ncbi:MAG: oligosaccharide flippase family protein, partial [Pseudonocardiales bacterium]|nr:oligosaccharide flippase family protein [Pseudonocardiales bacterium]
MTPGRPVPRHSRSAVTGPIARDLRPVFASGAIRALLLPVGAVLSLTTSHVLIQSVGATAFGAVIFIGTLFQLLPFADLGVGAAVSRAVAAADDARADPYVSAVVRRSLRIMVFSGAVLAAIAVVIGGFGWWSPLLGVERGVNHVNLAATACIVIFAAGLPLALGPRVLLGAGKNHVAIAAGIVTPVVTLILAGILAVCRVPAESFVVVYPLAMVAASAAMTLLAERLVGLPLSPVAAFRANRSGPQPVARVLHIALPMFMLSVGLPIGLHCDQLVISHRLPDTALSEYGLGSQLFLPGWAVLSAAAYSLLPVFTRRRSQGLPYRRLWIRMSAVFAGASIIIGLAFVLAAPLVADLISSDRVRIGLDLRIAFAALLLVQILSLVSGMMLNRPDELRFQAICVMAMMVANVGLSWWFAGLFGVAGPVIASALSVGLLMLIPLAVRGLRTSGRGPV